MIIDSLCVILCILIIYCLNLLLLALGIELERSSIRKKTVFAISELQLWSTTSSLWTSLVASWADEPQCKVSSSVFNLIRFFFYRLASSFLFSLFSDEAGYLPFLVKLCTCPTRNMLWGYADLLPGFLCMLKF